MEMVHRINNAGYVYIILEIKQVIYYLKYLVKWLNSRALRYTKMLNYTLNI